MHNTSIALSPDVTILGIDPIRFIGGKQIHSQDASLGNGHPLHTVDTNHYKNNNLLC